MYQVLERRLRNIENLNLHTYLRHAKTGLEKESLRVNAAGNIAQTDHPSVLGSALTHPWITTDYSEALLELITPPQERATQALDYLLDLETFVYQRLGNELLWTNSMPCVLRGEADVRIAEYGTSNAGKMKHVYRQGLASRYGKIMQVIAGIHYNYSISESFWPVWFELEPEAAADLRSFKDRAYIRMIRNIQRYGWLIIYLFGASPAICKSFLAGRAPAENFKTFREYTLYEPYGTSLRMGNIGYTNTKKHAKGIQVCYNTLESYVASLRHAISTVSEEYAKIGVKVDGEYRQLNANILQIENEYYSTVRPKQPLQGFEKPITALTRRGIGYVELRSLDINPFDPAGLTPEQMAFIEVFMHFCLLQESPLIDATERGLTNANQLAVAHQGRDPALYLNRLNSKLLLSEWAGELMSAMQGVAQLLDHAHNENSYTQALNAHTILVQHPELTPSARALTEIMEVGSFFDFANEQSKHHKNLFMNRNLPKDLETDFSTVVLQSLQQQKLLEMENKIAFDEFLEHYFNETLESIL
ncbi:MAG: glutamate--cysteine ligase [Thiofilum sp.]|uniref:glutamate--cysteine ligase n=1 Tax=Thiofilum sp. TaxID=2212733 RepID=UPI0025DA6251|nr:glutamate--cysteine ligase [Thiofilum sp.]MBK8452296.1 glutamate--cysteine ligase [Thiofilum sp.]